MIFGLIASGFDLIIVLPQLRKTYQTKDVSGLSICSFIIQLFSAFFWGIHGVLYLDIPIMISSFLYGFSVLSMIAMYVRFRTNPTKSEKQNINIDLEKV